MKNAFFAILLSIFTFTTSAHALPVAPARAKTFELMKCNSMKFGTLWASFGRMYNSDTVGPTYFPTEIVVFANDLTSRLLFPNYREALNIPVRVNSTSMSMQFKVPNGELERTHLLQIYQYDPRIDNGYMGNWTMTENGKEKMDQVACSLD